MPTAVLRRYTPPTCTLEIAATGSALSRWTDRTVLKNVRFNLSFDDPKLLPEAQVTVSGNRSQLEALCQTVGAYVQHLLDAAPEQILWEPALQTIGRDQLDEAVATSLAAANLAAANSTAETPAGEPLPTATNGIALQPRGLLSHDLHLGDLASAESGSIVPLSTLQLFDLANALEEYQSEALSLPTLERPWLKKLPQGSLKIAASAVLALGVTGVLGKFVVDLSRPTVQTATAPAEREVNSELSQELFPTLSPPPDNPNPPITIQPLPPPPPDGTPQSNSPGLPPVGVTQPQPAAPPPAVSQAPAPTTVPNPNADAPSVTVIPNPDSGGITAVPPASSEPPTDPSEPPRLAGVEPNPASSALRSGQPALESTGSNSVTNSATNSTTSSTAFDAIPQVAEIRGYFQERWQPPAELTQTLEYRLLLNADGSLQRIVPLGQAAANFIDRTNMPLMGEPFVSATSDGSTPQIRLVLKPNGSVQSFLEYAN